jgi:hypothetical protein
MRDKPVGGAVRLSARLAVGVLIVTPLAHVHAQANPVRMKATPRVTISATAPDGRVQFAVATWATRLPSGEIVIADQADGALRIADSSGRVTRSWGRLGDAPGEFRGISWVGTCGGDTLYAWDARAMRLSVMHARAGYVRQINAPASGGTFSASCDRRGHVALFSNVAPRRGGASTPVELKTADGRRYELGTVGANITVFDRNGTQVQELSALPYAEMLMGQLGPNGGMGAMPRPLGAATAFALHDGTLTVARTDSARITWYRANGAVDRTATLPAVRGAPTDAQYVASINRAVEIAPAPIRESLVAFAKQVPRPTAHRPFSQMLAGGDGMLWLVTSLPGDAVTSLRAINRTGAIVATLEINSALEVFEVGADFVLGRTETAEGEQRVVLYRLTRDLSR